MRPAVLVSDIVMPTEDGVWLIAQVRGPKKFLGIVAVLAIKE